LLWKADLGSGDASGRTTGVNGAPPVVTGDTLYQATNLGAIVALDASSGRLRWLARYPRDARPVTRFDAPAPEASKCVVSGDQVIVAPGDSRRLFAWDAATGAPLWDADPPADAKLVGVTQSESGAVVVLAGRQLAGYDTLTGQRRLLWPESPRSGVRGLGDAAMVGDAVYWPTREALLAIDPVTGGMTRSPIDLAPVGGAGANVIATDYGLLVCGPQRLRLLARADAMAPPEPAEPVSRLREADSAELAQQ
jgi:outer membrane protein assembly factor BamB